MTASRPPRRDPANARRLFSLAALVPALALIMSMFAITPAHANGYVLVADGGTLTYGYNFPGDSSWGWDAGREAPTVGQSTAYSGMPYSRYHRARVAATAAEQKWLINGVQVSTEKTYTPKASDAGKDLSLQVRYTYAGHTDYWWTPTAKRVSLPVMRQKIGSYWWPDGTLKVGSSLSINGQHIKPAPDSYKWQWYTTDFSTTPSRNTVQSEYAGTMGVGTRWTINPASAGQRVTVCGLATKTGYEPFRYCTGPNDNVVKGDLTVNVNQSGELKEGGSRTVSLTGFSAIADAEATIKWTLDGTEVAATSSTATTSSLAYTPSMRGKVIRANYTVTAPGYNDKTGTVEQTYLAPYELPEDLTLNQLLPLAGDPSRAGAGYQVAVGGTTSGLSLNYSWTIDGSVVSTAPSYTSKLPDAGKRLTATATATKSGYTTFRETKQFDILEPGAPELFRTDESGWFTGGTLQAAGDRAFYGSWDLAATQYEWQLDGETLSSTTSDTLWLSSDMAGKEIRVRSLYRTHSGAAHNSPWTEAHLLELPNSDWGVVAPATAKVGRVIELWVTGYDTPVTVTYEWREGSATGAVLGTTNAFVPPARLGGTTLYAAVKFTSSNFKPVTREFSWDLDFLVFPELSAELDRLPVVGETVSLGIDGMIDGLNAAYTWSADGTPIAGETGSSLEITDALRDAKLSVAYVVSGPGYDGTVTETLQVGRVPFTALSGVYARLASPAASAKVGVELTAEAGASDEDVTVAWQWKRGAQVVGTSASYTPVAADAGKTLTVVATLSAPHRERTEVDFTVAVAAVTPGGTTPGGTTPGGTTPGGTTPGGTTPGGTTAGTKPGTTKPGTKPGGATSSTTAIVRGTKGLTVVYKSSVKSRKKQVMKISKLVPGQRVVVKLKKKKIAVFKVSATGKIKVTKRAKVNGAKVVVKQNKAGVVTVKFKVPKVVKAKTTGLKKKAKKKAIAKALKKNTQKLVITGSKGQKATVTFRVKK